MHLQSYKTRRVQRIDKISGRNAIHPCFKLIAYMFNPEVIEFVGFKGYFCFLVKIQCVEPATSCFVINTSRPCTRGRVHLYLTAIYPAMPSLTIRIQMATLLDTSIATFFFNLNFKLMDNITVFFLGNQKGIGSALSHVPYNYTFFHSERGLPS